MSQVTSEFFTLEMIDDIRIVLFKDAHLLDQVNIERIRDELLALVAQVRKPKVIISFENVKHISSAVLGMLMSVEKAARAQKGTLRLAAIDRSLMEVFQITRLDKVFKIDASVDEAMRKL